MQKWSWAIKLSSLGLVALILGAVLSVNACTITFINEESLSETQSELNVQATLDAERQATLNQQLTEVSAQQTALAVADTPAPVETQPVQPEVLTPSVEATLNPTTAPDLTEQILSARILFYEDTFEYGFWVKDALDSGGFNYYMVKGIGELMNLLSGSDEWDLIIIAAEGRSAVSGEFWPAIMRRVEDGAGLIYETWTLITPTGGQAGGAVKQLLDGCGVQVTGNYNNPMPIYFYVPDHDVFNYPNRLTQLRVRGFWGDENIETLMPTGRGDAQILAGIGGSDDKLSKGVITTCYNGRVIINTFSNHDYDHGDIVALWQNYVYWTLKNRFLNP